MSGETYFAHPFLNVHFSTFGLKWDFGLAPRLAEKSLKETDPYRGDQHLPFFDANPTI